MARRVSSITAVGLASLALVPAAVAQTPEATPETDVESSAAATPTPAPTPVPTYTPPPEEDEGDAGEIGAPPADASKRVRGVYRDFRRDAIIAPCDHTLFVLRDTRDTVTEDFDAQYPDFLESVKAAISERKTLDCDAIAEDDAAGDADSDDDAGSDQDTGSGDDADGDDGSSTGSGGGAGPVITPAPIDPAPADPLPIDPLPSTPGGTGEDLAPDPLPPVETPAPLPETPAPAAPAAPAAPVAPPVAPAATPVPSTVEAEPATAPAPVWGLAAGGGLLALGGLVAPLFGARGGARLAAFEHAWGEAGFRIRGAWQDFRDWLRVGR